MPAASARSVTNSCVLSVIVPTFNERDSLPLLVSRLAEVSRRLPMELVIVDDASPDGTGALAESLAREAVLPITVIHRDTKAGLASAALAGAAGSRGRILTVMDADLSHPPELLPDLIAVVEAGADIAIASRYVPGGGVERWPLWRRMVSRMATWMTRRLLGLRVRDPLSGFFAVRREILTEVGYLGLGYKLLVEILARNLHHRVGEVPYRFVDRQLGQSKLSFAELVAFARLLVQLKDGRV